ncbi:MAG: hypothetical protein CMH55_06145 [Myxococcales bacterium]|nr:hypothetical protein [Myxococcales bacterium]|tara:strand:- start:267 stop:908 length:642 start_codon:yes stop_codon:yes gene_type:complete
MAEEEVEFRAPTRSFFTPLHVAVLAVALLPMVLTGVMVGRGEPPLPVLQPMPDFHLKNQHGERLRPQDLEGKVLVVSFLFTHCPDVCPATVSRLKTTADWLDEKRPEAWKNFRFVAFSLDRRGDQPETVKPFLEARGHNNDRWDYFLSEESLHPLVREGFKIAVREDDEMAAIHSDRVGLVGKRGQIRGYYELGNTEQIARFHHGIDQLLKEE